MHLLIPYVKLSHPDPAFDEFTYGDCGQRARKLKRDVKRGDYIFFHTTKRGKKFITAYYVVDRVLDTVVACQDKALVAKYHNPHIIECLAGKRPENGEDDVLVFGDPITTHVLQKPLPFDRCLAERLSLNIRFSPNKSETQVLGSATRAWRELTDRDIDVLLDAIIAEQKHTRQFRLLSSEEVAETQERDIEQYIAHNPALLGKGLKLSNQQQCIGGGRLDLLLEDGQSNWLVVEVKYGRVGRDAIQQVRTYVNDLQKETHRKVSGAIVCAGIMPAYEDELKEQRDIQIFVYGWDLRIEKWSDI
ncbi:MAG: DUF91 domain-containing protein [Candidatus Omnitrophica bacterium]|nr:DUF91 domain-containing protein [Candidatus Omnitrophota bacterium]